MASPTSSVGSSVGQRRIHDLRRQLGYLSVQSALPKYPGSVPGGYSVSGASIAETFYGDSTRKLLVRIGAITSPSKFWATAVYPPGPVDPNSSLGEILKLEESLDKMYGGREKTKMGLMKPESAKSGSLVAARLTRGGHWHRGKILSVKHFGKKIFVRVFLIDYGDVFPDIPFNLHIRKLPKEMRDNQKPRAFQVVLGGLRPVSLEVNYEDNFKKVGQVTGSSDAKWRQAANEIVLGVFEASRRKLAYLSCIQVDKIGRYHGSLEFVGFKPRVVLDQLLIRSGYAKFSEQALSEDLKADAGRAKSRRIVSICGPGQDKGTISIDESSDFTHGNFQIEHRSEASSLDVSITSEDCASSHTSGDRGTQQLLPPYEYLDPETGSEPNSYYKISKKTFQRFGPPIAERTVDGSFLIGGGREAQNSSGGSGKLFGKKLLELVKRNEQKKLRASTETMWCSFREDSDDDDLDEESRMEQRRIKREKMRGQDRKIMMLPAGIDTGKFLEAQLKTIPNGPSAGPKDLAQILP